MILVDAAAVSASRPGRPLFSDLSLTLRTGDRLGIVGINGCGKSTLLRVLAGTEEPDSGTVRTGRDVRVAMLDQSPDLGTGTVSQTLGEGWEGEAILDRLGMGGSLDLDVATLSGGQAKRVALARALVADADLLILDEPTNHLDLDAIGWLEARLAEFRGGLVMVTHDRHVLDRVTTRVLELDRGRGHLHEGGYDAYLEGRDRREAHAEKAEATRRNLARTELAWLRRGAPARTSKSKARITTATAVVEGRAQEAARVGDLPLDIDTPRLGDQVVELTGVGHHFGAAPPLFSGFDYALDPRERLGLVGPNGAGKTTLLRIIAGELDPTEGQVDRGATVRLELFDQMGATLDPEARVRDVVAGPHRTPDHRDAALMEAFWFDSDVQRAPVRLLSGGERRRLQLLVTLARRPNVLLLDEPTNDLDLDTLRSLESFLDTWPGALVVVSHDRAFLERTISEVVVVEAGVAARRPGGFGAYEEEHRLVPRRRRNLGRGVGADAPPAGSGGGDATPASKGRKRGGSAGRSRSSVRADLRAVEREQAALRAEIEETEAAIAENPSDHGHLTGLMTRLAEATTAAENADERWLELAAEAEDRGFDLGD